MDQAGGQPPRQSTPDETLRRPALGRRLGRQGCPGPRRTLSVLIVALLLSAAVTALGAASSTSSAAGAHAHLTGVQLSSATWYAPYVDATLPPEYPSADRTTNPAGQTAFGFIVATQSAKCTPSWGDYFSLSSINSSTLHLGSVISAMQAEGELPIVSFGGEDNQPLADACTTASALASAYEQVINAYGLKILDFDIEGAAQGNTADLARQAQAIKAVQARATAQGSSLGVWLTLPVALTGMLPVAENVVNTMLNGGVSLSGVNLMTMYFSPSPGDGAPMLAAVEGALDASHSQLQTLFTSHGIDLSAAQVWQHMGATVQIGQAGVADQAFSVTDAQGLVTFAEAHGLGRISDWSANQDTPCGSASDPTVGGYSTYCSGVVQTPGQFGQIFGQLTGSATATPLLDAAATATTDPSGSGSTTPPSTTTAPPTTTVTGLTPTAGPLAGGGTVTITGTDFTGASAVDFGTTPATTVVVVNATSITAKDLAGSAGTVTVTVVTPVGVSAITSADHFTYDASPTITSVTPVAVKPAGGTTVTIHGTNLTSTGATVTVGGTKVPITCTSSTTCTFTALVGTGTPKVKISTPGGSYTGPVLTYETAPTVSAISGYWTVASDGGIFSFGNAGFYGSMGGKPLDKPIAGMALDPATGGYWEVGSDGGIFSFDATFYGSMGGKPLNKPIVAIVVTPTGGGYWEVASDGGIFSFGNAGFYGSMGGKPLNSAVVGMAATSTDNGYWEVAADGGIFSFGTAKFHGSVGGTPLDKPMVGMAATVTTGGYWTDASDGGIFSFGGAVFHGSMGGTPLDKPLVGMAAS